MATAMSVWNLSIAAILLVISSQVHSLIEFTNIKCETVDESFSTFEYCFLKSVNRTLKYMSLKVNLLQLPVLDFGMHLKLFKRSNGYKPYMFKTRINNGCHFMTHQHENKIAEIFYKIAAPYSNINTTCPITHDLFVEKIPVSHINDFVTKLAIIPTADYYVETTWLAYGRKRATVKVYFSFK